MPDTSVDQRAVLYERLRREPSNSTVGNTLPVLFFGDLFTAKIATVALNPSWQEYLASAGRGKHELTGPERRFETLGSLGVATRSVLTDEHCRQAIEKMRAYFQPGKPIYSYFRALDRVTQGMGYSYERGEVAHLDLIQEATDPTWSGLAPDALASLRKLDSPFLRWEIANFPLVALVCNGKTVFDTVRSLLNGQIIATDTMARVTWSAAVSRVGDRTVHILGWNIPLARPTGLGRDGEDRLGRLLATYMSMPAQGTQ